ncbi:MAG: hypothetical protein A2W91_10990 [Bacteroidetes bacterium GWF2_38_335]|nr:MAG: hypothetical protein A2W91_10990 [Bacteroidetes bacterium GWF2_38_335]OFY81773.1 MAG: hypothetical protein A2281_06050 [Bacteroidetes bacterium RIFOXYA12_FULL_38_20]HBS87843.1 hypothetical protein [Bacteroidales bacterium]
MNKQVERIKDNLRVIKQLMSILCFFICTNYGYSQNINLSKGIGEVNCKYSYGKLIAAIGAPDSTYSFDPENSKSLAYNELFYDNNLFVVGFYYSSPDTLTKKTTKPHIEIFNGSSITLNGESISNLDSTFVVKKYGKPKSFLKINDELTMSYDFREKKYFSLLTFYYSYGTIKKIRIGFGKY